MEWEEEEEEKEEEELNVVKLVKCISVTNWRLQLKQSIQKFEYEYL